MARAPGDDAGFTEFAVVARPRLRRTAFLVCGDWDVASDLTQEALIRTYVAWHRIERRSGAMAYARRCVVNIAIDRGRRRWSSEVVSDKLTDGPYADHQVDLTERDALLRALRTLPPRQRACVALRYLEDMSVADTAGALGCSEGTVKSQTARALVTLRGALSTDLLTSGENQ